MIRKAKPSDQTLILESLKSDPSRSLFITGDILQNGIETDYQEVWLDEDPFGLHGIFLRYHTNLVVYVFDRITDEVGIRSLFDDPRITLVNGTKAHLETLPQNLRERLTLRPTYFCECREMKEGKEGAIKATVDDVPSICEGLQAIAEFQTLEPLPLEERIRRMEPEIRLGNKHAFILIQDGKVVSHAASSAETPSGMMVVAVYTLPAYRNRGYARQVVSALTRYALDHGQIPCLFYDNPDAGKLYHSLGYVTFDQWLLGKKTS